MYLLKALVAQLAAGLIVLIAARSSALPVLSLLGLACIQAVVAASIAAILRSQAWWLPIHLLFLPALVIGLEAGLPPLLSGLVFCILLLVYGGIFRTRVPLFLSSRHAVHRLAAALPTDGLRILDAGSGTGSFVRRLARLRPGFELIGLELAPAPFWLSRRLGRGSRNLAFVREDFWKHSFARYDLIYAFLSPAAMPEIWRKARREMSPGSRLVSNSFRIPGLTPEAVIETDDARAALLFVYRIPAGADLGEKNRAD